MRIALVELGNTGIRLNISAAGRSHTRCQHLNLGASVSSHGSFVEEDIAAMTALVTEFMTAIKVHNCQRVFGVATESFRLAANGQAVAAHVERETGCQIRILTPEEENGLNWQAAASSAATLDQLTVLSLNGGTLGITQGPANSTMPVSSHSFPLGVNILAPRTTPDGYLPASTRIRIERHIGETLKSEFGTPKSVQVALLGEMSVGLATLIHTMRRSEVPENVTGLTLDCADLGHLIKTFEDMSLRARLALPGICPRRAPHMPLGATILRQALRSIGANTATVRTVGLKDSIFRKLAIEAKAA